MHGAELVRRGRWWCWTFDWIGAHAGFAYFRHRILPEVHVPYLQATATRQGWPPRLPSRVSPSVPPPTVPQSTTPRAPAPLDYHPVRLRTWLASINQRAQVRIGGMPCAQHGTTGNLERTHGTALMQTAPLWRSDAPAAAHSDLLADPDPDTHASTAGSKLYKQ